MSWLKSWFGLGGGEKRSEARAATGSKEAVRLIGANEVSKQPLPGPVQFVLRIGMTMQELVDGLGQPDASLSASDFLGSYQKVSGNNSRKSKTLQGKFMCLWRKPEGDYELIVVDGRLSGIHRSQLK